jgi:GAF domain-containing protein
MSRNPLEQKIKRLNDRLDSLRKLSEAEPNVAEILDKLLDSIDGESVNAVENANRVLELATLNKIGQALSSAATLKVEQIWELVYEQTSLLMDTNVFYVALYDADSDTVSFPLAVEEGQRREPIGEWAPREAGRGLTEYIIRHREPLLIPYNIDEWMSEHGDEVELIGQQAKSWLGVPMISSDQPIGVIAVQNYNEKSKYDCHDLSVLFTIASQAAIAIANARLFESTQSKVEALRLLREVGQTITSTIEPQEVLRRVVHEARTVMDADIAALYPLTDGFFQPPFIDGETCTSHKLDPLPSEGGIASTVLKKGFVVVEDLDNEPELGSRFTKTESIRSFAGVALKVSGQVIDGELVGGKPVGVLYVDFRNLHLFPEDERNTIHLFATQAAIAIYNARLYERALEQRLRDLVTLQEINRAIGSRPLEEILVSILQKASELVGGQQGSLMMIEGDELVVRAWLGTDWTEEIAQRRLKIGEGITGWVAKIKKSYLTSDVSRDPHYVNWFDNARSELAAPLRADGRVIGVIDVESYELAAFTEQDKELFEAFASQAVIAIQNAERYREVLEWQKKLEALHEVDRAIVGTLDLEEVLSLILNNALQLTGAQIGELRLVDPITKELVVQVRQTPEGVPVDEKWDRVPPGQGITGWCVEHRQSVIVPDAEQDDKYISYFQGMRSEVAVPLVRGEEALGVVSLESPQVDAFDKDDLRLLETLAGQAVIALQNARNYEASEKARERFEVLTEVGRQIIDAPLDVNAILAIALEAGLARTGAHSASARLWEEEKQELKAQARCGIIHERAWEPIQLGEGVNSWVAQHQKTCLVQDVENPPAGVEFRIGHPGTRSELVVPLVVGDRYLGNLDFGHPDRNGFDEEEVKLIEGLAQQLAATIHRLETVQAQQEAEQRAMAAEVMSSIGQQTFELAHRLGNDLGRVKSYANNILLELAMQAIASPSIEDNLDKIVRDVQQVLGWSTEFRQRVAEFRPGERVVVPAGVLLREAAQAAPLPSNIQRYIELASDVSPVCVVPSQVADILLNLVTNAIQAMPEGGTLTLRACNAGRYVTFEVEDTGIGIPFEKQSRIFDLFYSTKGSSGFGLWSARRNALANGGDLKVKSQPGQGATFTLLLPRAERDTEVRGEA